MRSMGCLGWFSGGLSGPMAGLAFGKTVIDKGCEDRQHAILLFNMGYKAEALELLKAGNERVQNLFPGAKTVTLPDTTLRVSTVLGSEAPRVHPTTPRPWRRRRLRGRRTCRGTKARFSTPPGSG